LIGEQKANISDLRFTDRKPDFYRLLVDVDLRDVEHLHMVMTALEAETDVAQIAPSSRSASSCRSRRSSGFTSCGGASPG
jgi:hypothetical protein